MLACVCCSVGRCHIPFNMWFIGHAAVLSLFQGAFPARLKKVLIVGAPVWFRVPYNLLSLLLKEKLRERVRRDEGAGFLAQTPVFLMTPCRILLALVTPVSRPRTGSDGQIR